MEIDSVKKLSNRLFAKPETFLTPIERIVRRENENRKVIAKLKGEKYQPLSIEQVRDLIVNNCGNEGWNRLIRREAEQRMAELWERD